jgi:uncharacterized protein (DUF952 family)
MQPRAFLHISTQDAWAVAVKEGVYRAPSLDTEGFIHLSLERQWLATAARFFHATPGLVLLVIRAGRLTAPVRFEPADGDEFPHLYGELPVAAVACALPLSLSEGGAVLAPSGLASALADLDAVRQI